MSFNELTSLSIVELGKLIESKKISPVEVTTAYLKRIKKYDQDIKSYITVLEEEAIELAKKAESSIANGQYLGPLHGIPLAIKDNIDLAGTPTTAGALIRKDYVPEEDAPVVKKLLDAGMIPLGKANMHEIAMGVTTENPHFGTARNPWNKDKITGGSSGGSAAALAAHLTPASLGTDTGGSIRIPSACCGTVGLKPTFNRVNKEGVYPLSWSLDHLGPMTRTVQDTALMFEAMIDDMNPNDSFNNQQFENGNLQGKTISIPDVTYKITDKAVLDKFEEMVESLQDLGAKVEKVSLSTWDYVEYATFITIWVEAATIHKKNLQNDADKFGGDVGIQLKLGQNFTGVEYMQAQQLRRKIKDELNEILQSTDAIMLPTIPIAAPTIGNHIVPVNGIDQEVIPTLLGITSLGNVSGLPALAIPSGLSEENLPVGIQLIGRAFEEHTLFDIGYKLEQDVQPLKGKYPLF